MGIVAPNGGVHMAMAFLKPKLPLLPQCEQCFKDRICLVEYLTQNKTVH